MKLVEKNGNAATLSPRTLTAPSSYSKVNMSCPVVSADFVSVKVFRKYLRSGEGPHAQPEPREVTQRKSTRYMTVAGPRGVPSSAGRAGSRGTHVRSDPLGDREQGGIEGQARHDAVAHGGAT